MRTFADIFFLGSEKIQGRAGEMTLSALLQAIDDRRLEVRYDGQNVRVRPPERLDDELREAIRTHRRRLEWMCLHRIRPDETRPPWEFWFWGEWQDDLLRHLRQGNDV